MLIRDIQATIFYKHEASEVRRLSLATVPMADHIKAVCGQIERTRMKAIMGGECFRLNEARGMRTILLRAANHARAHLDEYFPAMRDQQIANAERLEEAVADYWAAFQRLQQEAVPTT